MKKLVAWLVISIGACVALLGLAFAAMYLQEGILKRIGNPDQSLAFWYLPILFIGVVGIGAGAALAIWGTRLRHKFSNKTKDSKAQPPPAGDVLKVAPEE